MLCTNLQEALTAITSRYEKDQVCVLIDSHIPDFNGEDPSWPVLRIEVSEAHKSIETVQRIWDFLFAHGITRRGLLICIGGGVLTDMGGFAAATYKRGIDFVNVPTTLLAMVDASSGGKTGINYHGLKNSIGCFAMPVETLICPQWLKTLSAHEMLSGFGEMLKTGLLEESLWLKLMQYDVEKMDVEELTPLIEQCTLVKERIVAQDPKEEGNRKMLNLGHTFGHALEAISIQQSVVGNQQSVVSDQLPHGYAVVYGLIAELYLSVTKLGCSKEPLQQLTRLMLDYYGRPVCKCSDREQLITLMHQDKKNERTGEINCTLIRSVGSPVINQVIHPDEAREAMEYLFSL